MKLQEYVINALRKEIDTSGMSLTEVATAAGLSKKYLYQVVQLKRDIKISTFLELCAALDVEPAWLLPDRPQLISEEWEPK